MTVFHADDAHRFRFEADGFEHWVYRDGTGPGVLLMHELNGMSPKCIELAGRIVQRGYTVYMPLFFGAPGDDSGAVGTAHLAALCVRREFECLATDRTSAVSSWLRALCRRMKGECGGPGVGAIGMCFTGSVILSVMLDDAVLVPVMCQPALPFSQRLGRARKRSLSIHPDDLEKARQRADSAPILGYRFATDAICPRERFARLREEFRGNFQGTEIPTGPDNPGNFPTNAHSVLATYFVDEPGHPTRKALDEILARFDARLH